MSIAVSAIIIPSRLLRRAVLGYGLTNLGAALALVVDFARGGWLQWLGAGCCLLAGVLVVGSLARAPIVRRIDISGSGQLRLTVQQGIGSNDARAGIVQLLPGSTIWPCLILLRFRQQNGVARVALIFPDSIELGKFRGLSVAIRDVAARTKYILGN
jgi:toxin CptA